MSELSEQDKQAILGQTRSTNEKVEALQANTNTPEKKLTSCESQKMSAAFLILTGIVLCIGGYLLNETTFGFEKSLGVLFVVIGLLWYVYLNVTIKRLRAAGVQAG